MKVLLIIVGALLAMVLSAALLLPLFVDEQALIRIAARELAERSGVEIEVRGDASLSLFPSVALETSDITVQFPDDAGRIEADYLQAGVALLPLLRSRIETESITIDGLTLTQPAQDEAAARAAELDTSTMTREELDAYYAARKSMRESAAANAAAAVAAPLALEVGSLSMKNIRARTVDSAGKPISELHLKFLTGEDLNTAGRPIPLTAQILLQGESADDTTEITIAGKATIDNASEKATLEDFNIVVRGATAEPLEVLAKGSVDLATQVTTVAVQLRSGDMTGSGTLRYAALESPLIDADLALTELNPALLVLAGPDATVEATSPDSEDADQPLPLHALRMIDSRARLQIDTVVLGAHKLEKVSAELRIVDGVATLKPVTATLHGGAIAFEAQLNGRYNTARVSTEGAVSDVDVGRTLAATETGLSASGLADLSWTLEGSGATRGELVQSLAGPIEFDTEAVTLRGIAMESMFCQGVALVNQEQLVAEFPADTRFEELHADVRLGEGVARLDPLTAKLTAVSLRGTGSVGLETQELQASIRAQLSTALGEMDPACRVNERYAELRWPVECRGNLAGDPANWCRVDTTEIIRDLAENEAKRRVEDEAGKLLKKLFE